jgi:hypothetical protein
VKYFSRQGKRDKSQRPQALVLESIRRLIEKDAADTAAKPDGRLAVKDVAAKASRFRTLASPSD